jgi:hypothetical protein
LSWLLEARNAALFLPADGRTGLLRSAQIASTDVLSLRPAAGESYDLARSPSIDVNSCHVPPIMRSFVLR